MSSSQGRRRAEVPFSKAFRKVRRIQFADGTTVLTIFAFLLYAVPSDRRIPALGTLGLPSTLLALALAIWWCWYHLQRTRKALAVGSAPVRIAAVVLLGAIVVSYIAASTRPISGAEISSADTGLFRMAGLAGILFVANEGIPDENRLLVMFRRLTLAGGWFAALGLVQFLTGQSFVETWNIPGMTPAQNWAQMTDRSGFARASATAMAPLEYVAVLAMIFPIAFTLALKDTVRSLAARWIPAGAITLALALSVSRSAIIALLVAGLVLAPAWTPRLRLRVAAGAAVLLVAMYAAVPGLIGTLRYLFVNVSTDSSASSRTDSYDIVSLFFERNPMFGRGFGTFLPQYRILDNGYLLMLIEAGIVGLSALVSLLVVGAVLAGLARRFVEEPLMNQLGQALAASIAVAAVLTAFFDVFSFPMAIGTMFLMLGLCGAYRRMAMMRKETSYRRYEKVEDDEGRVPGRN